MALGCSSDQIVLQNSFSRGLPHSASCQGAKPGSTLCCCALTHLGGHRAELGVPWELLLLLPPPGLVVLGPSLSSARALAKPFWGALHSLPKLPLPLFE